MPSWLCKPGVAGLDLHAAEHSGTPNARQTLPMDGGGWEREAGGLRWIWRSGRGGRLILKEQGHKRPENRSQAQAESHPPRELSYGPWVSDSALWLNRRSPADETLRAKRAAAPSEVLLSYGSRGGRLCATDKGRSRARERGGGG